MLCCSEGIFLQVLEGGRSAVNRLYNRIAADPRHTAGRAAAATSEIGERRFAGWSMGQVNMARLNRALLLKYSETATLDPFAVSGAVSMALFEELVATASDRRPVLIVGACSTVVGARGKPEYRCLDPGFIFVRAYI